MNNIKKEINIEKEPKPDQEKKENNILSSGYWKNTKAFKDIKNKETQLTYYKKNNASREVLKLVKSDSRSFGTICEKIITELFCINKRTSSQNDGTFDGKKIEIKSARYWTEKDNDCVWQHLEPEHDYEYVIFVLLGFQEFVVWCINKDLLMGELRDKKIVTSQGKQGWWTKKSDIISYLTLIENPNALRKFIIDTSKVPNIKQTDSQK